uniref:Uncharacterized protein n=1 Tax=Romanomermis culicivorax TaxID=13658 RepID=A0A915I6K7_ROMCU
MPEAKNNLPDTGCRTPDELMGAEHRTCLPIPRALSTMWHLSDGRQSMMTISTSLRSTTSSGLKKNQDQC